MLILIVAVAVVSASPIEEIVRSTQQQPNAYIPQLYQQYYTFRLENAQLPEVYSRQVTPFRPLPYHCCDTRQPAHTLAEFTVHCPRYKCPLKQWNTAVVSTACYVYER